MDQKLHLMKQMLSCVTYSGDQHTGAKIKETDPSAKLKLVNIIGSNGDWFIFNPDEGRKCGRGRNERLMSPLLKVGAEFNHHRACDAVLVALRGDTLRIVFIDLKSTAPSGFASQFQKH